jgi:hypothetical protein
MLINYILINRIYQGSIAAQGRRAAVCLRVTTSQSTRLLVILVCAKKSARIAPRGETRTIDFRLAWERASSEGFSDFAHVL